MDGKVRLCVCGFKINLLFFYFIRITYLYIIISLKGILKGTGDEDSKRPSRMQQPLNSELILSKDQLYDMFQQILGIKKFEHQILFNALMASIR